MYEALKRRIEALLRVPPEPRDPAGEEGSLRVFRAAPGFYRYRLLVWKIAQVLKAVATIVFVVIALIVGFTAQPIVGTLAALMVDALAIVGAIVSAVVSYVILRLDYEFRWYKITDRSLRIREGVFFVREMTMTFANIQNISVSQGPLQRYFNIADLKVRTAGGAGGGAEAGGHEQAAIFDMHVGYFRGVDNASEIRDLMMERLRRLRDAGLGDLDESSEPDGAPDEAVGVLADIRDEARAFRETAEALAIGGRA